MLLKSASNLNANELIVERM